MNLGQLIDPEWAQDRFPERHSARRQHAELLMVTTHVNGIVTRRPVVPIPQLNMPYELLLKDSSKTNYSSARTPVQCSEPHARPQAPAESPKPATSAQAASQIARMRQAARSSPKGDKLLKQLRAAPGPLSASVIAARAGIEVKLCCAHLCRMHRLKLIERVGKRRRHLYQLTPAGRARLEQDPPAG